MVKKTAILTLANRKASFRKNLTGYVLELIYFFNVPKIVQNNVGTVITNPVKKYEEVKITVRKNLRGGFF